MAIQLSKFLSDGVSIRVENYPETPAPTAPSILLLHGANGMRSTNPVVSGVMQYLGTHDFNVHLLHYFDRTRTVYADDDTIHRHSAVWVQAVSDGIAHLREHIDGRPLGIFGHSLGGYLGSAML